MRRIFNFFVVIALLSFFNLVPTQANAVSKDGLAHVQATLERGNDIYRIYVKDEAPDFGTYTVSTGDSHPATINMGARQDILYEGVAGTPWSSYLTVRSYTTQTEYTSNSSSTPSPAPGFSQANLDISAGAVTSGATWVTNNWSVVNGSDNIGISQTVAVEGTTLADSRVRVTTAITNNSGPNAIVNIGVRYEWDIMVDGEDGSYIKTVDPYSGWYSTEQEVSSPVINQFQAVNDPSSPIFYINGSVNGPAFSPLPTPPSLMQFADWGLVDGEAFDYTPTGQTIAGPSNDSAVTYLWGDTQNNSIVLGEGETDSFTQYLFAPMTESLPSVLPQTGSE